MYTDQRGMRYQSSFTACMIAHAHYFTDARIKNYVAGLVKNGYKTDVYALGDNVQHADIEYFKIQEKYYGDKAIKFIISYFLFFMKCFWLVSIHYFKKRYKFVHVHNMPNFLVFTAIIPKLCGAKIILDIHDTMPEAYATKFDLEPSHPLIRLLYCEEVLSGKFADLIIATNELHRKTLLSRGHPDSKILIIMNVGNEQIFYPRNRIVPTHNQVATLTLAYHGTIARRLGIDHILEAVSLVLPQCPNLRVLLIGDGEFMPETRRLIEEYSLEDIVSLIGWVPVESLPSYLSTADIGIIANRAYTEEKKNWMLPVKMLEYADMEIPTIPPRLKIISCYFDETNAIFYRPDDVHDLASSIQDVYLNREKIDSLKRGLREFNRTFNWANMERRYLDSISEMLCSGR